MDNLSANYDSTLRHIRSCLQRGNYEVWVEEATAAVGYTCYACLQPIRGLAKVFVECADGAVSHYALHSDPCEPRAAMAINTSSIKTVIDAKGELADAAA